MTDLWLWLRIVDYLLYGGVLTGIVMRFRHLIVPGWPGFRWGLWAFVAASAYGTAEVMFKGIAGGPRVVFLSLALVVLFTGCYLEPIRRRLLLRMESRRG